MASCYAPVLSITCGGVGINLKAANSIIICDPSYNPATEWQCIDRVYRLGQTREVNVYKLVIRSSIENRMLSIQRKKEAGIGLAIEAVREDETQEDLTEELNTYKIMCTGRDESDATLPDRLEIYNSVDGHIIN